MHCTVHSDLVTWVWFTRLASILKKLVTRAEDISDKARVSIHRTVDNFTLKMGRRQKGGYDTLKSILVSL